MHIFDGIELKGVDKNGKEKKFSLSKLGEDIVLYFYPKDNTLRCTQEARDFRDKIKSLNKKVTVVGVSPDDIESHKEFYEKNSLNFPLLSDPSNKLSKMLGIARETTHDGKKYTSPERSTFIIKGGLIKKAWKDVQVDGHVDEVLKNL